MFATIEASLIVQVLILLTLWGFAIDVLARRVRSRNPLEPMERGSMRSVLAYVGGGVAIFFLAIAFLAVVTG